MSDRPPTVAIYARTARSDADIGEQVAACTAFATQQGWMVFDVYADPDCLGTHTRHPEMSRLKRDATAGRFDIVLCEDLDRLSRDLWSSAHLHEDLASNGIRIWTRAEGDMMGRLSVSQGFLWTGSKFTHRGGRRAQPTHLART